MTWVIPLPGYQSPPLNLNQRMHWAQQRKVRTQLQDDVLRMARVMRVPVGLQRIRLGLHWAPAVVRRRDADNPMTTWKAGADALVRLGVVADDTHDRVSPMVRIHDVCRGIPSHGLPNGMCVHARLWFSVDDLGGDVA